MKRSSYNYSPMQVVYYVYYSMHDFMLFKLYVRHLYYIPHLYYIHLYYIPEKLIGHTLATTSHLLLAHAWPPLE